MASHTIAVKVGTGTYRIVRVLWGAMLQADTEGKIAGRAGPGSMVAEGLAHFLGAIDAPDNPLVTGEARDLGLSLRAENENEDEGEGEDEDEDEDEE